MDRMSKSTMSETDRWLRRPRETAPSIVRADEPRFARWVGMVGLFLVALAVMSLGVRAARGTSLLGPVLLTGMLGIGLTCLLFHAARDSDPQVRRTYGLLGSVMLAIAVAMSLLPRNGVIGSHFLPYGLIFGVLALLFLLAFLRSEEVGVWRTCALGGLGFMGLALPLIGIAGGNISETFLLGGKSGEAILPPFGLLLSILGLFYAWAYIAVEGLGGDRGYRAALGLGVIGAVTVLVALGRSILPPGFHALGWIIARPDNFLMPSGLVLSTIGLLFLGLSVGMCSDRSLVVLTRRELAAFFYSPVAYFVLLGFSLMGWFAFWIFIRTLFSHAIRTMQPVEEPIVAYYLWSFIPVVILVLLGIPVLTMRLLSEEQRTGTLEVLLTVPLSETSIVISKFLAVFILYLVLWLPWGLFLIALRVEGGQPFEYRPLLSFLMALASTGAGFLAMGLFFSSLTRNQIISAVLTALGILFFTLPGLMGDAMRQGASADSVWNTVLTHISYVDYWHSSLREGLLSPKFALFHLSAAVFWLFLTVKVLESRKWR
jgi:hypothetical protein